MDQEAQDNFGAQLWAQQQAQQAQQARQAQQAQPAQQAQQAQYALQVQMAQQHPPILYPGGRPPVWITNGIGRPIPAGHMYQRYKGGPVKEDTKRLCRFGFQQFRETGHRVSLNEIDLPAYAKDMPPTISWPATYTGPKPSTLYPNILWRKPFEKIFGGAFQPGNTTPAFLENAEAVTARQVMKDYLQTYYNLTYVSVLGWGGNGLACLFRHHDGEGRENEIVVKTSLRGRNENMIRETNFQDKFRDATHIVQLEDLNEYLKPGAIPPVPGSPLPGTHPVQQAPQVILLEYLSHGSLAQVISSLQHRKLTAPNRFLWEMWKCMLRGLLEFEYPPDLYPYDDNGLIDWADMTLPGENNVHFDIDPSNYMVGDIFDGHEDDNHPTVPVLKMSDFGCSTTMDDEQFENPKAMWKYRMYGKFMFYMPEQFTEEWDYVPQLPGELDTRVAAGKFTWKSNLFQAAQSLVCIMSGDYPQTPPHPTKVPWTPSMTGVDEDGNNEPLEEHWSYGAYIYGLEQHIDGHLKSVLVRCLMENPDHRPNWRELLEDADTECERYRTDGDEIGDHDNPDWPRGWEKDDWKAQVPWTDVQLESWIKEAILEPPVLTPDPADMPSPPELPAVLERRRAMRRQHQRQRLFMQWLNSRQASLQARVRAMGQEEYTNYFNVWCKRRDMEEHIEKCYKAVVKLRAWEAQFQMHELLRPADQQGRAWADWTAQANAIHQAHPFISLKPADRGPYVHNIQIAIENFRKMEFNTFVREQPEKINRWVQGQIQRLSQNGQFLSPAEITNMTLQARAQPISIPFPQTPIRKRIRKLQLQVYGPHWHHGLMIGQVAGLDPCPGMVPVGNNHDNFVGPPNLRSQDDPFTPWQSQAELDKLEAMCKKKIIVLPPKQQIRAVQENPLNQQEMADIDNIIAAQPPDPVQQAADANAADIAQNFRGHPPGRDLPDPNAPPPPQAAGAKRKAEDNGEELRRANPIQNQGQRGNAQLQEARDTLTRRVFALQQMGQQVQQQVQQQNQTQAGPAGGAASALARAQGGDAGVRGAAEGGDVQMGGTDDENHGM